MQEENIPSLGEIIMEESCRLSLLTMLELEQQLRSRAHLSDAQAVVVMDAINTIVEGMVRESASQNAESYAAGVQASAVEVRLIRERIRNTVSGPMDLIQLALHTLDTAAGSLDRAAVAYEEKMRREGVLKEKR